MSQKKCSHCQRRGKEPLDSLDHYTVLFKMIDSDNKSCVGKFQLCSHCMSNFALIFSDFSNDESIFTLIK